MKYIVAVIQSHKLEDVRHVLSGLGVDGLTVVDVRRYGSHEEHTEVYRADHQVGYLPRTKIEFAVADEHVQSVAGAIRDAAVTGEVGDGRIYILELAHTVQIKSGKVDAAVTAL